MANIYAFRNVQTKETAPVALFMRFAVGAVGAPTINAAQSRGILSITRTGVGAYTINLGNAVARDAYQRLMAIKHVTVGASTTAATMIVTADNSSSGTNPNIQVKFLDGSLAAVELGNGENIRMEIILSNSSV